MKIKAIFFDLDGTLVDSEYFHFQCWNSILQESAVALTYEDWLKDYAGIPLERNAEALCAKYKIATPLDQLISRREQLSMERLASEEVPLMNHAREMLDFLQEKDLVLALVTGSPRQDVDALFARNGLGKYFALQITSTDVRNNKPDPEGYERCRRELGLEKEECLVFEDTANGVKAAKAAGLTCFAIQRYEAQQVQLQLADRLFTDFIQAKAYLIEHQLV